MNISCHTGICLSEQLKEIRVRFLFTNKNLAPSTLPFEPYRWGKIKAFRKKIVAASPTQELAAVGRLRPNHVDTGDPVVENAQRVQVSFDWDELRRQGYVMSNATKTYNRIKHKWVVCVVLKRTGAKEKEHLHKAVSPLMDAYWKWCWVYHNKFEREDGGESLTVNVGGRVMSEILPAAPQFILGLSADQLVLTKVS